jgi:CRISPR-associated endonuclease/helicase Cas3
MRVLVDQTEAEVRRILGDLVWDGVGSHDGKVGVHQIMGGADAGEWYLHPEQPAVLIGTQDMLLSRALNRGYASPRARWPAEFGLLSQDALWVMDEVQLMDIGLATSSQLQAFRTQDAHKALRPCHTWWMSATLQPEWLRSVDTATMVDELANPASEMVTIPSSERSGGLWETKKAMRTSHQVDPTGVAKLAMEQHRAMIPGEHGRISLVIVNTVDRAVAVHAALAKLGHLDLHLVHSRFRGADRLEWKGKFLSREHCGGEADRVIVATQVVEAGVDISAGSLITDLAPWPSLVQRFGRAARYGGSAQVTVLIPDLEEEKNALPYAIQAMVAARDLALTQLTDVSLHSLEIFEAGLTAESKARLYPYVADHLLLRREYDELFDTTPDLTGADLDIARFIRSGDERDCLVFWAAVERGREPDADHRARRDELCPVPFLQARNWLCGSETKTARKPRLRENMRAWVWDWIDGQWKTATRTTLLPGRIVCVDETCGGYSPSVGFDPSATGRVTSLQYQPLPGSIAVQEAADDSQDGEDLSYSAWKTIACHGGEVAAEAATIARNLNLPTALKELLAMAGQWHDLGKAHPAFRSRIHPEASGHPGRTDLAKAPDQAWRRGYRCEDGERPGFRHELASALALFALLRQYKPQHSALLGPWRELLVSLGQAIPEPASPPPPGPLEQAILALDATSFDLLTYLVAAHHGKVRLALHAAPADQDFRVRVGDGNGLPIRGVREGDILPPTMLDPQAPPLPALSLSLSPAGLGLSAQTGRSWRERTLDLQSRFGPGALALLEAVLIAADRRASRLQTLDPILAREGTS